MKSFDDILKDKLEGLEIPFDASHWEQMEEAIEQAANTDPEIVDILALQHLSNLSSTPPTASWDSFESKLAASELASDLEASIDDAARQHLEDVNPPYDPNHWPLMRQRLDETFTIRGLIYRYKLAEIALMLLLLWTVLLYIPVKKGDLRSQRSAEQPTVETEKASSNPSNDLDGGEIGSEAQTADLLTENQGPQVSQNAADTGNSVIAHDSQISNPAFVDALPSESVDIPLVIPDGEADTETDAGANTGRDDQIDSEVDPLPALTPELNPETVELPEFESHFNALHPVAILEISPNAGLTGLGIKEAAPVARSRDRHLRVNMLSGLDYNRIFTPADPDFGTEARYLDSVGYSAGVLVDFQRGRWTFESGGIYAYKSYRPILPEQQFGTFDLLVVESFEGISLELFEIPLHARYDFLSNNTKWNFYIQGGASANLILKPIYEIRQESLASRSPDKKPSPEVVKSVTEKSILSTKDFPVGLFEGGNLMDNAYITTSIGFGLERSLSYRWSIYLQPQLQYQLPFGGFGPNNDRFNTVSFRLGTRVIVW